MANFEGYERRIDKINAFLAEKGIKDLDEARDICLAKGVDVAAIVRGIQPIAFENAVWAYTLGAANAIKSGVKTAAEAAEKIGEGLQAFCVPGSVADQRKADPVGQHRDAEGVLVGLPDHADICFPGDFHRGIPSLSLFPFPAAGSRSV